MKILLFFKPSVQIIRTIVIVDSTYWHALEIIKFYLAMKTRVRVYKRGNYMKYVAQNYQKFTNKVYDCKIMYNI